MPPKSAADKYFEGMTFAITGAFPGLSQSQVQRLITSHGGKVAKSLTSAVTHVLASALGSAKADGALANGLPLLRPEWLMACTEKCRLMSMTDKKLAWPGQEEEENEEDVEHNNDGKKSTEGEDEEEEDKAEDDEDEEEEEKDGVLQQVHAERAKLQALTPAQLAGMLEAEGVAAGDKPDKSVSALLEHRRRLRILAQPTSTIDPAIDASFWLGPSVCVENLHSQANPARPVHPYDVWLIRAEGEVHSITTGVKDRTEFCRLQVAEATVCNFGFRGGDGQPYRMVERTGKSGHQGSILGRDTLLRKKAGIRKFKSRFSKLTGLSWDAYQQTENNKQQLTKADGLGASGAWRIMTAAERDAEVDAQLALARRLFWLDPHCAQQLPGAYVRSGANASILLAKRHGDELHITWLQCVETVAVKHLWQRDITVSMADLHGDHSDEAVFAQVMNGPKGETTLHDVKWMSFMNIIREKTNAMDKYDRELRDCYQRVSGKHSIHKWSDHVLKADRQALFSDGDMQAALDGKYNVPVADETHLDAGKSPFDKLITNEQKRGFDQLSSSMQSSVLLSMQAEASSTVDKRLISAMAPYLQPSHYHATYLPVLAHSQTAIFGGEDVHASTRVSKWGGRPYLQQGEQWPKCSECGHNMMFWCQLRAADLPAELRAAYVPSQLSSSALFQHFGCDGRDGCEVNSGDVLFTSFEAATIDEAESEDRDDGDAASSHGTPKTNGRRRKAAPTKAKSKAKKQKKKANLTYCESDDCVYLRWIEPNGAEDPAERAKPDEGVRIGSGERLLTAWRRVTDYPESQEYDDLELELEDEDAAADKWLNVKQDKLGGFASWEQCPDFGECEQCGGAMSFFMQYEGNGHESNISSHTNGVITITTCLKHPNVLRYAYNCS